MSVPTYDGYPIHRLNTGHMSAWLISPKILRREMANFLAKSYRTGVVVVNPTLYAFALVNPNAAVIELAPPHKKFQFWQLANKPSARAGECACRNFWDPETQGPWGSRDHERERDIHHPHCQAREVAAQAWTTAYKSAKARVEEKRAPQARPDEWVRQAKELEG